MVTKEAVSVRVISWPIAAISAACMGIACVGCATAAKPEAGPNSAASRPTTTATATPSTKPLNLVVDTAVRQNLLTAFVAFRGDAANSRSYTAIPRSAVGGISKGTLFYALDRTTGTYWAMASFYPTQAASQTSAAVGFQDGGNDAVFMRSSGGAWTVRSVGPCRVGLPTTVAATWVLPSDKSPMCPNG